MNRCDICGKFRKWDDLRLIPSYDENEPTLEALACCRKCAPPDFVFIADKMKEIEWELKNASI